MQSRIERAKLSKAMGREPLVNWLVLAKCGAGLAAIAAVAAIGLRAPINIVAPTLGAAASQAATGARENPRPQSHRKQVFDERRARFGGGAVTHGNTREARVPANKLPLALR